MTTSYLVEAFKPANGELPVADQHFGYFSLRGAARRTITKEYEIGTAVGAWPFKGLRYKGLQGYQIDPGLYAKVKLKQRKRWTMYLSFDAAGNYELQIPELDVAVVVRVPGDAGPPAPAEVGEATVLQAGAGVKGLVVGKSTAADIQRVLGDPNKVTAHAHAKNYRYDGFACNVNGAGVLNTMFTEPGFAGRTAAGVRHGDDMAALQKAYGKPSEISGTTVYYFTEGILFNLDAAKTVAKIVVMQPR